MKGMGVGALGVVNRGVVSEIAPNEGDHLECDECGACIDICPVGALDQRHLSLQDAAVGDGARRHHLHALLERLQDDAGRAQRPDHARQQSRPSGINGEFLCIKGRYAFDFSDHPERLQVRWSHATASWKRSPGRKRSRQSAQKFA